MWWVIFFEFLLFVFLVIFFVIILYKISFGWVVYVIGNNLVGVLFFGIWVVCVKFVLFFLVGLMLGVVVICLMFWFGVIWFLIVFGWELEVVMMVVFGGVSIFGGLGFILGVVIVVFIMGMVIFGFGLLNVFGIVMLIFIGFLLIGVIVLLCFVR